MMMQANQITKQVLAFQKGVFSSWCSAASIMQDQVTSTVDAMLNQASWIPVPDQWRQGISAWVSTCKTERDRLKGYMEESLSSLEKCLVPEIKAASAKAQTPTAEKIKVAPVKPQKPAAVEIKAAPAQETKKATQ
jgi:hypothetical protein